jgi:hypothetical protein
MLIDDDETIICANPGLTAQQIAGILFGVNGYAERVHAACSALAYAARVKRQGAGKPGDPFTYHPNQPAPGG